MNPARWKTACWPFPPGLPASALVEAGNYLNARTKGKSLAEARETVLDEVRSRKALLDQTAAKPGRRRPRPMVWRGSPSGAAPSSSAAAPTCWTIRIRAAEDLDRVRDLFAELETFREPAQRP
jgi:heat-inducible transcriptional repressor